MAEHVEADELAVGGEARVVPVVDVAAPDLVAALVSAGTFVPRFIVATAREISRRMQPSSVTHMPT